jgi:hypothetical protein
MSTMMPNYEEGQVVNLRPQWLMKQRQGSGWDGAQGIIEQVITRYLPAIDVLWLSGPKEGKVTRVPFYQIIPEGQEELLNMELEDEETEED